MASIATCPKCGFSGRLSDANMSQPIRCRQCKTQFNSPATINQSASETNRPLPPPLPAALPAQIGRFHVRRHIGSGAFGAVYLAHDQQLDREVAVKVLRPGLLDNTKYV